MKTITLSPPTCAFCQNPLQGTAIELDSGKRLHEPCLETAAEIGLKARENATNPVEEKPHPQFGSGKIGIKLSEDFDAPLPDRAEPIQAEPEPQPVQSETPFVSMQDRAAQWLKEQLADGERWTAELFEAGEAEGFSISTLRAASTAIGAENRRVNGTRFGKRLPGETRLLDRPAEPAPAEEEHPAIVTLETPTSELLAASDCQEIASDIHPEPAAPTVALEVVTSNTPEQATTPAPEPLSPSSYVRRRDALKMTDAKLAFWLESVGEGALELYASGQNLLGVEAARRVERLLLRLEGLSETERNRYRHPRSEEASAQMFGAAYQKVG